MGEGEALLAIPDVGRVECAKNLIHTAVCELRIPTVLELETIPPGKFAKSIKQQYPVYTRGQDLRVNFGPSAVAQVAIHTFTDRKRHWVISFKSSALTLETSRYQSFDDFHQRLLRIIEASKDDRDSDFFVRVGLRYIDILPVGQDDLEGWINYDLAAALLAGTYGSVKEFWQTIRGEAASGPYTLRHGLREATPSPPGSQNNPMSYVLDMDFYKEDVELVEVDDLLRSLHHESFKLFAWAIGEKARDYMGWKAIGENDD